jgi:Putative prokaryotic signal transducing protein
MTSLAIIARFASRSEAMVAQSLLQSEGVETLMPEFNVLMAELDPSMMEHGWRLMGRSDDVSRALEILRDAQLSGED